MRRKAELRTIIIFSLIVLFSLLHSDTIIDTLYSIPYLDGGITYDWDEYIFFYNTGDTAFEVGDSGWNGYYTHKGYLSYELPDVPEGFNLQQAEIFIEQYYSIGNGEGGIFPIWNVNPLPDTTGCITDHVNYGNQLTPEDWTAGDPGDPQTLHSNIGVISDNATYEFKNLDVTASVQEDYNTGRDKTQYRLRFLVNCDWDNWGDLLRFHSGNAYDYDCPYIIYTWWDGVNSADNYELSITNYKLSNYPNPFNPTTTIEFSIQNDSKIELIIYNIKGQKIKTLAHNEFNKGNHSVIWNGDDESNKPANSGVYLYKLNVNGKTEAVKRCLLLK
jgi:hypothetical protein